MSSPLAFLLGCAVALCAVLVARRVRRRASSVPALSPEQTAPARSLAEKLGAELADLATAIDGGAEHLCAVLHDPAGIPEHADRLRVVVLRLRRLSEKVMSSTRVPTVRLASVDVRTVLARLRDELCAHALDGLQVESAAAATLPAARSDRDVLGLALLFLVHALLELEPNARLLGLRASTRLRDDEAPRVEVVVEVETAAGHGRRLACRHVPLAEVAARNLLTALGAELDLSHRPGARCRAHVLLPAAGHEAPAPASAPAGSVHPFGGVLLVETDPAVRRMVQAELSQCGRHVVPCADTSSARSLFDATRERFELLVVDAAARRGPGTQLAAEALAANQDVRVLLLASDSDALDETRAWPAERWCLLEKPFTAAQVREAAERLLATRAGVHL